MAAPVFVVAAVAGTAAASVIGVGPGAAAATAGPRVVTAGPRVAAGSAAGAGEAGAVVVARRVAVVLWSFDWRRASGAAPVGLRPLVTARLWAELQASPGAPAAEAERIAADEVDRVGPVSATVDDVSPDGVGVAVSAQVSVSRRSQVVQVGRDDADLFVVSGARGWRVDEIVV